MPSSQHETTDIYLASFLFAQNAILTGCRRVGRRRNSFSFVADEKLHELLRVYWRQVPMTLVPAQLFAALRQLKSLSRLRGGMQRSALGRQSSAGAEVT